MHPRPPSPCPSATASTAPHIWERWQLRLREGQGVNLNPETPQVTEMAQRLKVPAAQPDDLSLVPRDPHDGNKTKPMIPRSCSLTSTHMCATAHAPNSTPTQSK